MDLDTISSRVDELDQDFEGVESGVQNLFSNVQVDSEIGVTGEIKRSSWNLEFLNDRLQREVISLYTQWSNGSKPLIRRFLPQELEGFEESEQEVMECLRFKKNPTSIGATSSQVALKHVHQEIYAQNGVLSAIPSRLQSESLVSERKIASKFEEDELRQAKEIFEYGTLRPAGAVAGVALERHLKTVCDTTEPKITYSYDEGIVNIASSLNEKDVISDDDFRLIEYLSGIRNKCVHADEEPPNEREVDQLIDETEGFIERFSGP